MYPRVGILVTLFLLFYGVNKDVSGAEQGSSWSNSLESEESPENGVSSCDKGNILRCNAQQSQVQCDSRRKYRTQDGTCNNLGNPFWGSAASCYNRLLQASYADNIRALRKSVNGKDLPAPRLLSLKIHQRKNAPDPRLTPLFMLFGQFLSHEINLTPFARSQDNTPLNCCGADANNTQCMPLAIGSALGYPDPFYTTTGQTCINMARSIPCDLCITEGQQEPINQINLVTGFIDGSVIYGNDDDTTQSLRSFVGGKLTTYYTNRAGNLLPQDFNNVDNCSQNIQQQVCFRGGDSRVNQHLSLTALHTVWMRFHNYIAHFLGRVNRNWGDERLFQEARRIVGASFQMIVYDEYLPWVVGPALMDYFDLWVREGSDRTAYNADIDPSLSTDFSSAPYRFGHSMVQELIKILTRGTVQLRDTYFQPFRLYNNDLSFLMKGISGQNLERFDPHLVEDVTNFLYRRLGTPFGLDLAAINIARGRDNGLRPYVDYVRLCTCRKIADFDDLADLIEEDNLQKLKDSYDHVGDIDLFSGGLSEKPVAGGVTGPTFACIIARQFWRLKYGDRFYFEHEDQAGSFTFNQMNEIRKMTLGKIFCLVTNIESVHQWVLRTPKDSRDNYEQSCNNFETIDLGYFQD